MTYRSFIKFISAIFALLAAAGLTGCVKEFSWNETTEPGNGNEVTITVRIPGQRIPYVSRSIAGGGGEAAVTSVDVLVFKQGVSGEVFAQHVAGESIMQSGGASDDYMVRFTAKLESEPSATTVAILANVPTATITAAIARTDKPKVLEALTHSSSNAGGNPENWKWNTSGPGDFAPIPMYGEEPVNGIDDDLEIQNVPLTRMLARIDVKNNAEGFKLTDVYVVNYNTAGYIAPAWDETGKKLNSLPSAPMLPDAPNTQKGETNAMVYSYLDEGLLGEIYVYEAAAASGSEGKPAHMDAICLIVKGEFEGKSYFYRIDFTSGVDWAGLAPGENGFHPPSVSYMPVYRNYCYKFEITDVDGVGYENFGDALRSAGITNNMKCSFLVVDDSGIYHVVWNGEHFIGTEDKKINLALAGEQNTEFRIRTNYAGGWLASVENAAANSWFMLKTSAGSASDRMLVFDAAAFSGGEWAARSCVILLKSGRLQMRIPVIQGNYRIVAETAAGYTPDGVTQHSFKIKSNTQWAVHSVSDPDGILLDSHNQIAAMVTRSGGNNTSTGNDFVFTLVKCDDGSLTGKTFVVTLFDPTGMADDVTVVITAAA